MPNILIAPNSFKECADSAEIAGLFAEHLPQALARAPNADKSETNLIIKPVSDGGDGFLNTIKRIYRLEIMECKISSPLSDDSNFTSNFGYCKERREIYIESAEILGLKRVSNEKRKPLELSSKGLGDILKILAKEKLDNKLYFNKAVIGIGGTATTDFGIGICGIFGMKLYDGNNKKLEPVPKNFPLIRHIEFEKPHLPFEIEVVIDVDNPLTGRNGAAKIFAPQKGASPEEVEILEEGINNIVRLLRERDKAFDSVFLSGAGGGLGGCLHYFFNAKYKKSDEFILDVLGLRNINPDFVITGEGSFDLQSMMSKASGIIINEFAPRNIPVFVCCGKIDTNGINLIPENVKFIELSKYFSSREESKKRFKEGIQKACYEIADIYN